MTTCPCGRPVPATTYNHLYCTVRCRRLAQYAKERACRSARWANFWRELDGGNEAAPLTDGDSWAVRNIEDQRGR